MDLTDQLKSLKRKPDSAVKEDKPPGKGRGRMVLEIAKMRPAALTLVIQKQTCANCGAVEEHSNRHLLATHAPPQDKVLTVHVGKELPSSVPLRTQIIEAPAKSAYCKECWPGIVAAQEATTE